MEKYLQRGVSAAKEEVHAAVKKLDHGLFPTAFCKIYPDFLAHDDQFCNVQSSDGSGTKSILAYLYWKETGDISVWKGIAQDAIVMNLDDLLCVGAANDFLLTSIINRNKFRITGDVIAEIIRGTKEFVEQMNDFGIRIHLTGGETADLGDLVSTITVDASMTTRLKRSELVLTKNIQDGDVVIGLASDGKATYETSYNSGISSNGLTSARHDLLHHDYAIKYPETYDHQVAEQLVYAGSKKLTDKLEQTDLTIGQALLSPTRTFAPIIQKILAEMPNEIHAMINCTGGAHSKVLHYVENVHIIKDNLLPVPPLFQLIQQESKSDWKEMFKVLNCGVRFEIYSSPKHANTIIEMAKSFGVNAQIIGYVEKMNGKKVSLKFNQELIEYE